MANIKIFKKNRLGINMFWENYFFNKNNYSLFLRESISCWFFLPFFLNNFFFFNFIIFFKKLNKKNYLNDNFYNLEKKYYGLVESCKFNFSFKNYKLINFFFKKDFYNNENNFFFFLKKKKLFFGKTWYIKYKNNLVIVFNFFKKINKKWKKKKLIFLKKKKNYQNLIFF